MSSRRTRRSLNDEVQGLIEGEPSDDELALEQLAEDPEQVVEKIPNKWLKWNQVRFPPKKIQ